MGHNRKRAPATARGRAAAALVRIVVPGCFLLLALSAALVSGQMRGRGSAEMCYSPEECPRTAYDGRFTFVRVYFDSRGGGGGRGFRGRGGNDEPEWHHDRPLAERNLSSIVREISFLRTFDGATGGNVFALDDPEIFRYPVLWMAEPGFWRPTEEEAEALRAFLLKGGFIIFDDFRGSHWLNFEMQMRRVLPELQPIRLTGDEPIFESFFTIDMDSLSIRAYNDVPEYWGFFENNDPTQRQIAMINYNNDIGEAIDYDPVGFSPVSYDANEAYKLGVNYIIYALTH